MKVRTNAKAGTTYLNHNETVVAKGMKVKTNVKAGRLSANHNETLVAKGMKVKTNVKAGGIQTNHNETMECDQVRGMKGKTNLRLAAAFRETAWA